jgi:DNA-binding NtrC family response regulator
VGSSQTDVAKPVQSPGTEKRGEPDIQRSGEREILEPRDEQGLLSAKEEALLVVDDDDDVRRSTVRVLRRLGYRVEEACDGEEARQMLASGAGPFSLVLTDMLMPRMTGTELADVVRERYPELQLLLVTGFGESFVAAQELSSLQKPFHPRDLALKVRAMLDAAARERRDSSVPPPGEA